MKVIYFSTLYNKETEMMVLGDIEFKDNAIIFASGGHEYRIELEYVRRIETIMK